MKPRARASAAVDYTAASLAAADIILRSVVERQFEVVGEALAQMNKGRGAKATADRLEGEF